MNLSTFAAFERDQLIKYYALYDRVSSITSALEQARTSFSAEFQRDLNEKRRAAALDLLRHGSTLSYRVKFELGIK